MRLKFWGTRGSIPTVNANTSTFGGNTPCVSIDDGETVLVLDAGSGIRKAAEEGFLDSFEVIHILLTHLHMDHIQGLGFFYPFFIPGRKIVLWGPKSDVDLEFRLNRYLSPPLFPVRIRDFNCDLEIRNTPMKEFQIGPFTLNATYIGHPWPTLGYRVSNGSGSVVFMPDHEPVLAQSDFPGEREWTSGYNIAADCDVLIHDAQFTDEEYATRVGWGHSSYSHALQYAKLVNAAQLYLFHHDPAHTDTEIQEMYNQYQCALEPFPVSIALEGSSIEV